MTDKKSKMVPLSELTLLDRFLFDEVMEMNRYTSSFLKLY